MQGGTVVRKAQPTQQGAFWSNVGRALRPTARWVRQDSPIASFHPSSRHSLRRSTRPRSARCGVHALPAIMVRRPFVSFGLYPRVGNGAGRRGRWRSRGVGKGRSPIIHDFIPK